MKQNLFCILKEGSIFSVRDATKYMDNDLSEIINALGIKDSLLCIKTPKYTKEISFNEKPFHIYPNLVISTRPMISEGVEFALEIKPLDFSGKITVYLECITTNNILIPKFPVSFEINSLPNKNCEEILIEISNSFDIEHKDSILLLNNEYFDLSKNGEEFIQIAINTYFTYQCTLLDNSIRKINHRKRILEEIISTERSYVNDLNLILNYFHPQIEKSKLISNEEINLIFKDTQSIFSCHAHFLDNIFTRGFEYSVTISDVLIEFSQFFKLSKHYIGNIPKITSIIKKISSSPVLDEIIKHCPNNNTFRDLMSFLITPVQRMPRYLLFIRELVKVTPKSHPDFASLKVAFEKLDTITRELENAEDFNQTKFNILNIEKRLTNNLKLTDKPREVITSTKITLQKNKNGGYIHQFTDSILITSLEKNSTEKPLYHSENINVHFTVINEDSLWFGILYEDPILVTFLDHDRLISWIKRFQDLRLNSYNNQNLTVFWQELTSSKVPNHAFKHDGVIINENCYFLGGGINMVRKNIEPTFLLYNIQTENLINYPNLAIPFQGCTLNSYLDILYLFGGSLKNSFNNEFLKLNPNILKWEKIEIINKEFIIENRSFHSSIIYENYLYIFGGINSKGEYLNDILIFDFINLTLNQLFFDNNISTPSPRICHSAVNYMNLMIIHGGNNSSTIFNDIWAFDLINHYWSQIHIKNFDIIPRSEHKSTIINHFMFIIGGYSKNDLSKLPIYVYDIPNNSFEILENSGNSFDSISSFFLLNYKNNLIIYGGFDRISKTIYQSLLILSLPDKYINEKEKPKYNIIKLPRNRNESIIKDLPSSNPFNEIHKVTLRPVLTKKFNSINFDNEQKKSYFNDNDLLNVKLKPIKKNHSINTETVESSILKENIIEKPLENNISENKDLNNKIINEKPLENKIINEKPLELNNNEDLLLKSLNINLNNCLPHQLIHIKRKIKKLINLNDSITQIEFELNNFKINEYSSNINKFEIYIKIENSQIKIFKIFNNINFDEFLK